MLKYIVASGIALSALFVLLEIGVNIFGNMIKIKREAGISLKIQFMNVIKSKQWSVSPLFQSKIDLIRSNRFSEWYKKRTNYMEKFFWKCFCPFMF